MELKLEGIQKSYTKGKDYAVEDFSMTLTPGIYGLLGPNGAGKSTLMNIITDNLKADKGNITLDGESIWKLGAKYRSRIGYMPQQQGLYEDFTGEKFLWYMAALKGIRRRDAERKIQEMLALVNLKEESYKKLKSYSGGMKQRILIAQAMLNEPDILIMDEPTAGLDPKERIRIRNFISELSKERIVLLATHVVSDIEYISKEIIVIKQGRILKRDTPRFLLEEMQGKVFEALVTEEEKKKYEKEQYKIANIMFAGEKICLRIVSDHIPKIGEVREVRANLEDMYLYYVGD